MDLIMLGLEILAFSMCMVGTILSVAGGVCVLKLAVDFIKGNL